MTIEQVVKKLQTGGHFATADALCQKCRVSLVADRHAGLLTSLCESATDENFEERAGGYAIEFVLADLLRVAVSNLAKTECKCYPAGSVAH